MTMNEHDLTLLVVGAAAGAVIMVIVGFMMDLWCTCRGAKTPNQEFVHIDDQAK